MDDLAISIYVAKSRVHVCGRYQSSKLKVPYDWQRKLTCKYNAYKVRVMQQNAYKALGTSDFSVYRQCIFSLFNLQHAMVVMMNYY